jgi:hypothetical protein
VGCQWRQLRDFRVGGSLKTCISKFPMISGGTTWAERLAGICTVTPLKEFSDWLDDQDLVDISSPLVETAETTLRRTALKRQEIYQRPFGA